MNYSNEFQPDDRQERRSGKGFYIVLALCLAAIGGVAIVTFLSRTPIDDGDITVTTTSSPSMTTATTARQVVVPPATGVPDSRTTMAPTQATGSVSTTATVSTDGLFVFPASNTVLFPFSDTLLYSETLGEWMTHNGVDFAAQKGQEVKATADGVITAIREDPLWGAMIEIKHGDKLFSRCYGVTAKGIQEGQTVKAGTLIGIVSDIPAEIMEEPHVHLEILANSKFVNPLTLIKGTYVTQVTETSTTK